MNSTSGSMSSKLLNENTPFAIRESFNRLRTNLMYTVNDEGGCPVWGITSANEAVGKSTIIANLAISFCYAGQKVLLVDADMRHSTQEGLFGLESGGNGLSELLSGIAADDTDVIRHIPDLSLDLITAGRTPPNPSELMMSNRLEQFIRTWRQQYDTVFIDFPPVGIVTDALAPCKNITGYIVAIRAEKDNVQKINQTISAIEAVGAKVLGVVLNGINTKGSYKKYYGNHYTSSGSAK